MQGSSARASSMVDDIISHRKRIYAAKPLQAPAKTHHSLMQITVSTGERIAVDVYRPSLGRSKYPTILYVPGTAFVAREIAFTNLICSHLSVESGCQVIVLPHKLAPEHPFPQGYQQSYDLMRTILTTAGNPWQINKNQVILLSYSSGGTFGAAMAAQAVKDRLPIAKQILISPVLDLSRSLTSHKEQYEVKDHTMSDQFVDWFIQQYVPEGQDLKDPLLSPYWQPISDVINLPQTELYCAEFDKFRSDSEAYYRKLKMAGVPIQYYVIPQEQHSYVWYKLPFIKSVGRRINLSLQSTTLHQMAMMKKQQVPNSQESVLHFAAMQQAKRRLEALV